MFPCQDSIHQVLKTVAGGLVFIKCDLPEALTAGKEKEYLSWFYTPFAYNPYAITQADVDEYVRHYSAPGGMRAGFEYYRAFPITEEQNKVHAILPNII